MPREAGGLKAALTGKVAVVTGASKASARGSPKRLGAAGAAVVVNYASSRKGAERVVARSSPPAVRRSPSRATFRRRPTLSGVCGDHPGLRPADVLVNNAASSVSSRSRRSPRPSPPPVRHQLLGPLLTTREAVKHFRGGGASSKVSSVASTAPRTELRDLLEHQGAVDTLTQALALELESAGDPRQRVNPGFPETEA